MHSPVESSVAPAAPRRIPLLALQAAGVVIAFAAQFAVTVAPGFSIVAFALAATLFIVAERLRPPAAEPASAVPSGGGIAFWVLFVAGLLVCAGAGLSVAGGGERITNHVVWATGLLLLAASALVAWR